MELALHRERTRCGACEQVVLCAQDGADLNFAEHPGSAGLDLIGKNANSHGIPGLHMHPTLAVSTAGVPPKVPQIQYDAPDGKAQPGRPTEERKTFRWIRGLREGAAWADRLQGPRMVSVMDCERDMPALFSEQRRLGNVALLVRAKQNRVLGRGQLKLFY